MAVVVKIRGRDETLPVDDAASHVGMIVDAAIEDRDANPRAGVSGLERIIGPEAAVVKSSVPATWRSREMKETNGSRRRPRIPAPGNVTETAGIAEY